MRLPRRVKYAVVLIIGLPAVFLLFSAVIIPLVFKATMVPVHADPARVPAQTSAPVEPHWAFAAGEAGRMARTLVVEDNLPGVSVAVGVDGRLVWAGGFGWADIEARRPVTPDTLFRIGTVSKSLTAAAVGLLRQRGQLDLDAPVQRYVPAFPQKEAPITTRQAMAHIAGLRHHRGEDEYMPQTHCDNLAEALALFADDDLKFTPGTDWRYSTYGWILVSAVVESAAGRPFEEFMATDVFAPLGMRATVPDPARQPMPQRTQFYWPRAWRDTSHGLEHPTEVDYSCFTGAGYYLSTPSDLVRFAMAMDGHALLDAETTALLQTPVTLPSGKTTGYGLGWFVERAPFGDGETLLIHHPGIAVGGMTVLRRYPEHGIVVAVTTNVTFAKLAPFAAQVAALFAAARSARVPARARDDDAA
ncbi:MAG TPA: serine hydrolase domain-containing protein [Vicinamibacterales bacterium]|nr:serine hydrolase domain-containing protein [Vicinamibacterales bacterium]